MDNHNNIEKDNHALYQEFVDNCIQSLKNTILNDPQTLQSEKGKILLVRLEDSSSDIYARTIQNSTEEMIESIEGKLETERSHKERVLLPILKNPPHLTKDDTIPPKTGRNEVAKKNIEHPVSDTEIDTGNSNDITDTHSKRLNIPNDVYLETIEKIHTGWSRIDIAKYFLSKDPRPVWLQPLSEMNATDAASSLSQLLRKADPRSVKFASSKYQEYADTVREAAQEELQNRVYTLVKSQIDSFEEIDKDFLEIINSTKEKIDTAENDNEARQNKKLWLNLIKERISNARDYLTYLHNILNSRPR